MSGRATTNTTTHQRIVHIPIHQHREFRRLVGIFLPPSFGPAFEDGAEKEWS
ncbi:hypothetical protein ZHAS_00010587 [Anopheles sinensis]|uniref:Uncharacterized protein n=1 Tax=Anopheles sinensis TaxID=74873 RepID=A0A084VXZ3_ANOSI|nr:hypothetical protein ZHAS_00010587 [Anopheles sinensis]